MTCMAVFQLGFMLQYGLECVSVFCGTLPETFHVVVAKLKLLPHQLICTQCLVKEGAYFKPLFQLNSHFEFNNTCFKSVGSANQHIKVSFWVQTTC